MERYKKFAITLAEKAGEIMLEHFAFGIEQQWKSDNTPVTIADTKINAMVIAAVTKSYPKHAVLGEEESNMQASEYVWVCDPIDGTVPYSSGIPVATFSLALTHHGEPVVSVLYDPFMKRMYTAVKGFGSYINKQKLQVSSISDLNKSVVAVTGRSTFNPHIYELRKHMHLQNIRTPWFISCAYEAAMVATGSFTGVIVANKNPWDVAAVKLLIDEAGGKTSDLQGKEQRYDKEINGFVASNGIVHKELLELVKHYAPKS